MDLLLEKHSNEIMILLLTMLVFGTLLVLVPKLLHAHQHTLELQHTEHMRALEQGHALPQRDALAGAAGRTASLVPMVVVCSAGVVTCFLSSYKSDSFFAVSLAVWSVTGVVGLAAITGGVALMGRLAQLHTGHDDEAPVVEALPPQK